jgi:hypothetical protein
VAADPGVWISAAILGVWEAGTGRGEAQEIPMNLHDNLRSLINGTDSWEEVTLGSSIGTRAPGR